MFLSITFQIDKKITFVLLKVVAHVKGWWETFCEKKETKKPSLFIVATTWKSFMDDIEKKYYLVGSYDNLYTKWTTLQEEGDQAMPDFTNIFHTLRTKMGIKYLEQHLVLKYCVSMYIYIQNEMEFMDIFSLGTTYRYVVKIEQTLKQNMRQFGPGNLSQKKPGKGGLNLHKKGHRKYGKY
jgi:hypothetical protein